MDKNSHRTLVIVSDYDGTLTDKSTRLHKGVIDAIIQIKMEFDTKFIIASGRNMDFFLEKVSDDRIYDLVDAFVAENGAVIHLPESSRTMTYGKKISNKIKDVIGDSIPQDQEGEVMISTKKIFKDDVEKIILENNLPAEIQYNRDSLMVLPSGITKATAVMRIIGKLDDNTKIICMGDAENDLPLFEIADLSVAPSNSVPEVKKRADVTSNGYGGIAIEHFLKGFTSL